MKVGVWDAEKDIIVRNEEVKEMIGQGDGIIIHTWI